MVLVICVVVVVHVCEVAAVHSEQRSWSVISNYVMKTLCDGD